MTGDWGTVARVLGTSDAAARRDRDGSVAEQDQGTTP